MTGHFFGCVYSKSIYPEYEPGQQTQLRDQTEANSIKVTWTHENAFSLMTPLKRLTEYKYWFLFYLVCIVVRVYLHSHIWDK